MADIEVASRSKRRKVSVACEPCRARKTKCDGCPPVCGPCRKRGVDPSTCEWDHATPAGHYLSSLQSEYVQNLERRLRDLERPVTAGIPTPPLLANGMTGSPDMSLALAARPNEVSQLDYSSETTLNADLAVKCNRKLSYASDNGSTSRTMPVPVMLGPGKDRNTGRKVSCNSSARSFMHHIHKMSVQLNNKPTDVDCTVPLYPSQSDDEASAVSDYALPSRQTADNLMEAYWAYVHPMCPFIAKRVTMRDYDALWQEYGVVPHERSFHCLINIMLALASQVAPTCSPDERARSGTTFYKRAKRFLSLPTSASVRDVQIYLLFGLYLQTTNELHECWILVGLAIRTAQSLDLHLAETSEYHPHSRQRSLLRRVWYGCVLMDRHLARICGRPCTIGREEALAVDYPISVEGEIFPVDSPDFDNQSPDKPTRLDLFHRTLTLYDILYDILRTFYSESRTTPTLIGEVYDRYFGGFAHTIPSIDERLTAWDQSLPRYLMMHTYCGNTAITQLSRQAIILRQRFLHVRILLLRPSLSALITVNELNSSTETAAQMYRSQRSRVAQKALIDTSVACFRAAQEAINIVHARQTPDPRAVTNSSSWWHNILYIYTAATVVIATRARMSVLAEITEAEIANSWQQSITTLQHYSVFGPSIAAMVTSLQLLHDSVSQTTTANVQVEKTVQSQGSVETAFDFGDIPGAKSIDASTLSTIDISSPMFTEDMFLFDPTDTSWLDVSPFQL